MKKVRFNIIYIILVFFLLFLMFFSNKIDNVIYTNYLYPLLLLVIAAFAYKESNNNHGRFTSQINNKKTILIATLFYIIIYYLSGLVFGFAKTIYAHDITSIILNIYHIIVPIIFIEYIRSYVINENKNNKLFIYILTIIFIMIEINYPRLYGELTDNEKAFQYIAAYILPLIFGNILYTYLTINGSYKLVLIYRVIIELSFLLTPVFPAHDWFIKGVFGIIAPAVVYMSIKYDLSRKQLRSRKEIKKTKSIWYIPVVLLLTLFVLFMAGLFKATPIAILSNSMSPLFCKGDVVIYNKITEEELKNIAEGTIIVYSKESQIVVHRVINVYQKNNEYYFITKGDANNAKDGDPVNQKEVLGIYTFHVKYIGWPSVKLNEYFKNEKPLVEIK